VLEIAAGILPIYTRTPTLTAMTAAGLDYVSDGRFTLGLGSSGPQVIEGFHGVQYDYPLARTREVIEICRQVWRREPVSHQGKCYQMPATSSSAGGPFRALKLINHPVRDRIPIVVAAIGPKNVALAAELAEGWLPPFFHADRAADVWGEAIAAGQRLRDPVLGPLNIFASTALAIGDDVDELIDKQRPGLALYIGGMGTQAKNYYNDLACRYGFEREAHDIQELYLSGHRAEAEAAVPYELLQATSLIGPAPLIAERLAAYRAVGVGTVIANPIHPDPARQLADIEVLRNMVDGA
jgi:F420-dependent oxidoreductase-like protein